MPDIAEEDPYAFDRVLDTPIASLSRLPAAARYGLSLLLVLVATGLSLVAWRVVAAPSLTLIYVLPVIVAANLFGWGPSLLAVVGGVAAYDFFFTVPYYSLSMTDPSEIWSAGLLLIIATVVAAVAATSRRRAAEATDAAERAEAMQALAHVVVTAFTRKQVLQAAATALHRIFGAPAMIFVQDGDGGDFLTAGVAQVTPADEEAAGGSVSARLTTCGETYPTERTYFDFWPVSTPAGCSCSLGVDFVHATRERPTTAEKLVEGVAGYVAAALTRVEPDATQKVG